MTAPQGRQLVEMLATRNIVHRLGDTGKLVCAKKIRTKAQRVTFGAPERVNCAKCKKAP